MQFSLAIISALSAVALAIPNLPIIGGNSPTQVNKCGNGQTAVCCASGSGKALGGGLGGLLGSVLPVGASLACTVTGVIGQGACSGQTACCNSGNQNGNLIAVGNICPGTII